MHITENMLAGYIDARYLKRGYDYFLAGAVELKTVEENFVKARCAGERIYRTELRLSKNGALTGDCSCPAYEDFGPCKHLAAVGYAVIAHYKTGYASSASYQARNAEVEKIENLLRKKTKSELINMIFDLLDSEPELYADLLEECEAG